MSANPHPYRTLLGEHSTFTASALRTVLELDDSTQGFETQSAMLRIWLPLHGSTQVEPAGNHPPYVFSDKRIAILPPGSVWAGRWHGSMICMAFEMAPSLLEEYAGTPVRHPERGPLLVTEDARIRHLLSALHQTLRTPTIPDELFTQYVARAVACHYLRHYCGVKVRGARHWCKLNRQQMKRIGEFIESRLADKVALEELAQVVGMNSTAFCRRFRRTVGMPPYRYVLHARIERAKRQLGESGRSLCEIGCSLGFYDQSQFANTFRRVVGISPSAYRNRS